MKTIRLHDNFIVNIDSIYSLQKIVDNSKETAWNDAVNTALQSDNFKQYIKDNVKSPTTEDALKILDIIESQIGSCPEPEYQYIVTLNTGIKIDIDEKIYNVLNDELEKYLIQ